MEDTRDATWVGQRQAQLINNEVKGNLIITIDSVEVARMLGVEHWEVLRKLEGSKDRKGYIEILNDHQMVVVDYFIKSRYEDSKGESRPCYLFTKMGCDFIANKFTGEKGIIFTAKYVKKFNEMEQQQKLPGTYKEALIALIVAEEEKENLQLADEKSKKLIGELKPKAEYTDNILNSNRCMPINTIAKDYGMSAQGMNNLLHELGIQYKQGDQWFLYTKYQCNGYTHSEPVPFTRSDGRRDSKMNTKWTQKGRMFIYELLKEEGILPSIEKREYYS